MAFDLVLSLVAIVILQVISAYFSAAETSLTAVSKARMHTLANEGSRRANDVNKLIANRERMISAILLGNNFFNILASAIATSVTLELFNKGGILIATAVMTVVILVFSEVLPKTLAIVRTDRIALACALPMRYIVAILSPILAAVQFVVWKLLWLLGVRSDANPNAVSAHEELRGAIDLHHQEGAVEREHRDMLGGILDLKELQVADVMVHRKNMVIIDADGPPEELVERLLSSGHTRFPLWRDDPENIVGVLHIKDLLSFLMRNRGALEKLDLMELAAAPWFVPDTTTLEDQVRQFRDRHAHFALVVDEYGTLQGLITLEDILEEVFGNIAEQSDQTLPEGIVRQPDGSYIVEGTMALRDINRELDWGLPDENATTIAGLVITEARIIPDAGQVFSFHGYKFEILRRVRNQIALLRITPNVSVMEPNEE